MKRFLPILLFFLIQLKDVRAQFDTLTVIVRGEYSKNEQYYVQYNGHPLGNFGHGKPFLESKIFIDTNNIKPYEVLPLRIYKIPKIGSLISLDFIALYDPRSKYIHIYWIKKLKKHRIWDVYYFPFSKSIYQFGCE